jgi:ATP-binding cassette, subfamily C (CFTR/MRP), member 1
VVGFIGAGAFILLSHLEHKKSTRPSTILTTYFLFTILFDTARSRTLWAIPNNTAVAAVSTTLHALKVVILILEAQAKGGLLNASYNGCPPEATAGIFNRSLLWWINPLLLVGYRKDLSVQDLYPIDKGLSFDTKEREFWRRFKRGKELVSLIVTCHANAENLPVDIQKRNALLFLTLQCHKGIIFLAVIPRLFLGAFTLAQPFLVSRVIDLLAQPNIPNRDGIGWGLIAAYALVYIGIAVSGFRVDAWLVPDILVQISTVHHQHQVSRSITAVRGTMVSAIYQNSLQINLSADAHAETVTLMTADVERINEGMRGMHETWASPIQAGIAVWLLVRQLRLATVAAIAVPISTSVSCVHQMVSYF